MDQTMTRLGYKVFAILLMAGSSPAALAQSLPETDLTVEETTDAATEGGEEILVTGSRIQRRDAQSVGPITTLTAEDIAFTAPTSVGDLVQQLPSVGVSLNSNGTQGTSFGVSSINLRYLGSGEGTGNRTLVLVDGHRWVNAVGGRGFRDFVDLNTIPIGIVERIEVLKDGASAIYGADAIAGVVNIQTKRNIDGFEAMARSGISEEGDNRNFNGYLNWGGQFGALSVLASINYNDTRPLLTSARPLTDRALTPLTAPPTSPFGLYVLPGLANNAFFGTPAAFANNAANAITRNRDVTVIAPGAMADGSFNVARLPGDDFNTRAAGIYAIGPSERAGVFGRLEYDFAGGTVARLEGLYVWRESSQLFAPFPLDLRGSNGYAISRDQAFNPFGTANGVPLANALAFSGNSLRIQRVATEVGNRNNVQEVETYRIAAGLQGDFALLAREWRWDAHFSYSRNEAVFDAFNQINFENVYRALVSPAACAAAPGCAPLNIYGVISPEQADYIRFNGRDEQTAQQYDFTANVAGELFELPGGPAGIATGYEYRREEAEDLPDSFANTLSTVLPLVGGNRQAPTTAQSREPTSGSYDLHEVYGELNLPLLADLPFVYRLAVDAAVRYSHYSTVGGRATSKVGLAWRPVEDLLLRGTFAEGFRAPSILELFQGARNTNFQAVDPCNNGGGSLPGCAGVPASYNQSQFASGLIPGVTIGNEDLEAETSQSWSAGVAFTPTFLPGLSITADWFKITVKDAIAAQTAAQILQNCAVRQAFCDLIQRAPTGEVLEVRQAVVNLASIEVMGVDASIRYLARTGIGNLEGSVDVSYLDDFKTAIPRPDGTVIIDERAGKSDRPRSTFPHWKGQAALRYIGDDFSAGWKARYIGPSDDIPNNAVNGGRVSAITYHDLQVTISHPDDLFSYSLGVDNVTDEQPPASAANNPVNFDIYTYDIRGRYYYVRIGVRY